MVSDFYEFLLIKTKAAAKTDFNINFVLPVSRAVLVSCIFLLFVPD